MYKILLAFACVLVSHVQAHVVSNEQVPIQNYGSTSGGSPQDILNGVAPGQNSSSEDKLESPLRLSVINRFPGGTLNAYITARDLNGNFVLLQDDFTFYYPTNPPEGERPPTEVFGRFAIGLGKLGTKTPITIPQRFKGGRIYFVHGTLTFYVNHGKDGPALVEPDFKLPDGPYASTSAAFAEFTWDDLALFVNLSFVDFIGLVYGMVLTDTSGVSQTVMGLPSDAVDKIAAKLQKQAAKDKQPWSDLPFYDKNGDLIRIINPVHRLGTDNYVKYWAKYADKVWKYYTSHDLFVTISGTTYTGRVDPNTNEIKFNDPAGNSFAKPSPLDIFGCDDGPFKVTPDTEAVRARMVPVLCAAFNRATLLRKGGNKQPSGVSPSDYYKDAQCNQYARFVHKRELDGKGYAFPYDDSNVEGGEDLSGSINTPNPKLLEFTVGDSVQIPPNSEEL